MAGILKQQGTELQSESHFQALINLASIDKADFDGALRRILEIDAKELQLARVNCWQFERDPLRVHCLAAVEEGRESTTSGSTIIADQHPAYFQSLIANPVMMADDALHDERTSELGNSYLQPLGITSLLDVPIWVDGTLWGVVCHEHVGSPHRSWSIADRDFALAIGNIVSMAVEARQRAQAEQVAHARELFMGTLSHDLRGPLNAICLAADFLLQKWAGDASTASVVATIKKNAVMVNKLVEQLLDATRAHQGAGPPIECEPLNLGDFCRRIAADVSLLVSPGHAIKVREEGNLMGQWDPIRLWQLLSNLCSNSLQHTSDRSRVRVHVDGTDTAHVRICISNPGSIPSDLLAALFEPFHTPATRHGTVGSGLGLYIAREAVLAHGGQISVDADEVQVAFMVELPRQPRC